MSLFGFFVLLLPVFFSAPLGAASVADQASFANQAGNSDQVSFANQDRVSDQASVRELNQDQWLELQSGTRAYTVDPYGYVSIGILGTRVT